MVDLLASEEQIAVADSLRKFCLKSLGAGFVERRRVEFSRALWRAMAELGVLALAAPDGDGAALLVAASEELGRAGFPGPLAASAAALRLLPASDAAAVAEGSLFATLGTAALMPWGMLADRCIDTDGENAWLLEVQARQPIATLGGEACARLVATRGPALPGLPDALAWHDLVLAAQHVGAGLGLVEEAAAHARTRAQFGTIIGNYQGVAFPLAEASIALDSARLLLLAAATALDSGTADAARLAGMARLSASRAARRAAFTAHQTYGAFGVTAEGPVFWLSRRIQQWALTGVPDRTRARRMPLELPEIIEVPA